MSLILEALRKSEAERRRAQTPDLFAEPQLALPQTPRAWPSWTWPALGIAGLIAGLWLLRGLWPAAPATAAHAPAIPQATVAARTPQPSVAPRPEPAPAPIPEQAATLPPPPVPVAVAAPVPAPPAANASATVVPTPPVTQPRLTPGPATTPSSARAAEPARPEPAAPPTPATGDLMRLADLGTGERQQLPPLKLSMHMWNDAPAQRFVILDGQRLGEGDRIGDAVVEQITRDGAILAWNGRRLTVSMR